jgi:hypothetical protein
MPLPLAAIPLVLTAAQSLVRFRDRVDDVLALNKASEGLPFALPEAPTNAKDHWTAMKVFFATPNGQLVLEVRGLNDAFATVSEKPFGEANFERLTTLFTAYCEAADKRPTLMGPPGEDPALAAKGPSSEMRLAWFLVESQRLSRNSVIARISLITADTLLEFGAASAGLWIKHTNTRAFIEDLLTEFAVKRDWDDEAGATIFKHLLGSAAAAFAEHGGQLSNAPIVQTVVGALTDLRAAIDDDDAFIDTFASRASVQQLAGFVLRRAADSPELWPGDTVARDVITTVLRAAGDSFDEILEDPKALLGVVESGLAAAASHVGGLVDREVDGKPLLAAVLKSLAGALEQSAGSHTFFKSVADGEVVAALYQTALRAVAARPDLLAKSAGVDAFVSGLVSAFAGQLAGAGLEKVFSTETLRRLVVTSLDALLEEPEMLAGHGDFLDRVLGAVLPALAAAARDGLSSDDVMAALRETLLVVSESLGLVEMDDQLRTVLEAVAGVLTNASLAQVLSDRGRKDLFIELVNGVVSNPRVWAQLAKDDLAVTLIEQVIRGLTTDPTRLLASPFMADTVQLVVAAAVRDGRLLIDGKVKPKIVGDLLAAALAHAQQAVGAGLDASSLSRFLAGVVEAFLVDPFDLAKSAVLIELLEEHLPLPDAPLALSEAPTRTLRMPPTRRRSRRNRR